MKAFMDKDFMLQSATAQHLYHDLSLIHISEPTRPY